jgi:hypothetical protein
MYKKEFSTWVDGGIKFSVPKTSSNPDEPVRDASHRWVTVRQLANYYNLNVSAIYAFIRTMPDFPYINVGLKRKYMVDRIQFEAWLTERTEKQKQVHFNIPTAMDLLASFRSSNDRVRK